MVGIKTDTIDEKTTDTGVTIDGQLVENGVVEYTPTQYVSVGGIGIQQSVRDNTVNQFDWQWDDTNNYAVNTVATNNWFMEIHLPHGATATAFRVTSQEVSAVMVPKLHRITRSSGATLSIATLASTSTMSEQSYTGSPFPFTVDNNTYYYLCEWDIDTNTTACRMRHVQVDFHW